MIEIGMPNVNILHRIELAGAGGQKIIAKSIHVVHLCRDDSERFQARKSIRYESGSIRREAIAVLLDKNV